MKSSEKPKIFEIESPLFITKERPIVPVAEILTTLKKIFHENDQQVEDKNKKMDILILSMLDIYSSLLRSVEQLENFREDIEPLIQGILDKISAAGYTVESFDNLPLSGINSDKIQILAIENGADKSNLIVKESECFYVARKDHIIQLSKVFLGAK